MVETSKVKISWKEVDLIYMDILLKLYQELIEIFMIVSDSDKR